jgi:hypothetical protein
VSAPLDVIEGSLRWCVEHGSALDVLRTLPDECIDALICDPPSGIKFMGRDWDCDKGGSAQWIAWLTQVMREVLRVLKPGAHGFVWALPRTSHWTGTALELAGFEIRDCLHHVFGSGFPKSVNVERDVACRTCTLPGRHFPNRVPEKNPQPDDHVCPVTPESEPWKGYGTAAKPAQEHWWLVRKPLRTTIAGTVQEHGTGALNIDGCRVGHSKDVAGSLAGRGGPFVDGGWSGKTGDQSGNDPDVGRWPPNFLLSHSAECRCVGTTEVKANPTWDTPERECESTFTGETVSQVRHGGETETVDMFECALDCPVRLMDEQSGNLKSGTLKSDQYQTKNGDNASIFAGAGQYEHSGYAANSGGASRFFPRFEWDVEDVAPFLYMAKPSRGEKDGGLEHWEAVAGGEATGRKEDSAGTKSPRAGAGRNGGARNVHPTVKSKALMRYLCKLGCPPGGIILDWCCGSGTTGVAAMLEGFRFIGIDLNDTHEEPFVSIARARIQHVIGGDIPMPEAAPLRPRKDIRQGSLF